MLNGEGEEGRRIKPRRQDSKLLRKEAASLRPRVTVMLCISPRRLAKMTRFIGVRVVGTLRKHILVEWHKEETGEKKGDSQCKRLFQGEREIGPSVEEDTGL